MESRSRGLLDTPQEPVIGLAEGETHWRGMTGPCGSAKRKPDCFVRHTTTHEKKAIFSAWLMRRIGASGSTPAACGRRTMPLAIRVEPSETSSEDGIEG
jgi:hypothetical protein